MCEALQNHIAYVTGSNVILGGLIGFNGLWQLTASVDQINEFKRNV